MSEEEMDRGEKEAAKELASVLFAEIIRLHESLGADEDAEFGLTLSPMVTKETNYAPAFLDAFELVTSGSQTFLKAREKKLGDSRVLVLEMTVPPADTSNVTRHSFVVIPLPAAGYRQSLAIPTFQGYAFVDIGTSGYGGDGPDLTRREHEMVKGLGKRLVYRRLELDRDPLNELFQIYGPVIFYRYPDSLFPRRRSTADGPLTDIDEDQQEVVREVVHSVLAEPRRSDLPYLDKDTYGR